MRRALILAATAALCCVCAVAAQAAGTPLTFGLLGKALAQEIHALLWGPFIMLVLLHLYLAAPVGGAQKER